MSITNLQVTEARKSAYLYNSLYVINFATHEELYVIISGKGEYEVDGEKTAVSEGSIIRVAPAGVRALRNNSDKDLVMMCIQYEAKPITSFMDDANIFPLNK